MYSILLAFLLITAAVSQEPDSYFVEYTGQAEIVQTVFDREGLGGQYWKSGNEPLQDS